MMIKILYSHLLLSCAHKAQLQVHSLECSMSLGMGSAFVESIFLVERDTQ